MTTVRGLLRERRAALGLSQEALAEAIGVSSRSVNRWEQGGAVPHPDYRRRLAHVLGIDPAELAQPSPPDHARPWHVPMRRNPFFTGRDALLAHLHAALGSTGAASHLQALSGLAGIGKTQAALEYAWRYAETYQAVFWLPADTREA